MIENIDNQSPIIHIIKLCARTSLEIQEHFLKDDIPLGSSSRAVLVDSVLDSDTLKQKAEIMGR